MKTLVLTFIILGAMVAKADETKTKEEIILGREVAALERWNHGDPTGFLEISARDVVYFDPFLEKRVNGLDELTKLYLPLKGQIQIDRYEMIAPLVQSSEKMAVLTFNLVQYEKDGNSKWNCTEVYRLESDGSWKIIQTHWSLTKPELK